MTDLKDEGALVKLGSNLIFISHSNTDKDFAVQLKGVLRGLGFQGFVAHMDIEPSHEWEGEILKALRDCAAMVVIASDPAKASPWVNHEIGAMALQDKPAISIMHGCAPWTLISHRQALRWEVPPPGFYIGPREALKKNTTTLYHSLKNLGVATHRHLIEGLGASMSFDEANALIPLLETEVTAVGGLSADEADRLAYLASMNQNVYQSYAGKGSLPTLLAPLKDSIHPQVLDMLDSQGIKI